MVVLLGEPLVLVNLLAILGLLPCLLLIVLIEVVDLPVVVPLSLLHIELLIVQLLGLILLIADELLLFVVPSAHLLEVP